MGKGVGVKSDRGDSLVEHEDGTMWGPGLGSATECYGDGMGFDGMYLRQNVASTEFDGTGFDGKWIRRNVASTECSFDGKWQIHTSTECYQNQKGSSSDGMDWLRIRRKVASTERSFDGV